MQYWIFPVIAALVCGLASLLRLNRRGLMPLCLLLGGAIAFIGAKVFYVLLMAHQELPWYGMSAFTRMKPEAFCFTAGAACGCLGVALASRLQLKGSAPDTLDSFAPGIALAICILRLGECCFGSLGYGTQAEGFFATAPFAVANSYGEWYYAIYRLEAFFALICAALFLKKSRFPAQQFSRVAFFLAMSQILAENLRKRGMLYGFVHAEQLVCAVILLAIMAWLCRKARTWLPMPILTVLLGAVVGIEFLRQRSGIALFSRYGYILMVLDLAVMGVLYFRTEKRVQ